MKINKFLFGLVVVAFCSSAMAEYSGQGGMTKKDVTDEAYLYHYEHGFTGEDAMSWDPNLQFAWSRAGAAQTCGIAIDKEKIIDNLVKTYGDSSKVDDFMERFVHDMNGIGFHHVQSKSIDGFCSADRVSEIKSLVPKLEQGDFPKNF